MFTSNKGVVLISVLLIILMLSVISVSIGKYYFLSFKREGHVDFQNDAIQYIQNIEVLSINEIKKQFMSHTARNLPLFSEPISIQLEKGMITAKLKDATSCFNINALMNFNDNLYLPNQRVISGFRKYLKLLDYNDASIDSLIDQVIDWIDTDNQPRANGLEDYFYIGPMSSSKQFTSKRFFYHLSEIKNLPASSYFDWQLIEEHFCVIPFIDNHAININFLGPNDVLFLAALIPELTISDAEMIIENIPDEGFQTFSELNNFYPYINFNNSIIPISVSSKLFFIESQVTYDSFSATARTLINYNNNKASILTRSYNGI
ncbi:type II secretion system protein GspK [Gammaproteobacteria bacterium]|nr:type II secretion system protein GspK [Gammaproteobacteria bacterium]